MNRIRLATGLLCVVAVSACGASEATVPPAPDYDWRNDWGVQEGFALEVDTDGYRFPSAIAFVPEPGPGPDDPLYFVTELRGTVKVVTNDRSVHTFAEGFVDFTPRQELPASDGQTGLAGICLDPATGYVFVTFTYADADGMIRYNLKRFETEPRTFALQPGAHTDFGDVFGEHLGGVTHQIGPCQVLNGDLYVGVGDGWKSFEALSLDHIGGKILRMTLDGDPLPTNPFYDPAAGRAIRNYVWSYGFRNPFSMKMLGSRLFVADNGADIDRFLEVRAGENYLWNGDDWSIASNAAFVFAPAIGPVQMDYHGPDDGVFPADLAGRFFIAASALNNERRTWPGIVALGFDTSEDRLAGVPDWFVRYLGPEPQMVAGLAFGPDGLYFAPLFPDAAGRSGVFRITYDPPAEHPVRPVQPVGGRLALLNVRGCFSCHSVDGRRSYGGFVAPALDTQGELTARLNERLHSREYVEILAHMQRSTAAEPEEHRAARQAVLEAEGRERVRVWLKHKVLHPRFDNPASAMPDVGLTEHEAGVVANFLLGAARDRQRTLRGRAAAIFRRVAGGSHGPTTVAGAFLGGLLLGTVAMFVGRSAWRRPSRRPWSV